MLALYLNRYRGCIGRGAGHRVIDCLLGLLDGIVRSAGELLGRGHGRQVAPPGVRRARRAGGLIDRRRGRQGARTAGSAVRWHWRHAAAQVLHSPGAPGRRARVADRRGQRPHQQQRQQLVDARRLEAAHRVAPIAGIGTTDHGAHDGSVVIVAGADDAAGAALVVLLHCSELHSFIQSIITTIPVEQIHDRLLPASHRPAARRWSGWWWCTVSESVRCAPQARVAGALGLAEELGRGVADTAAGDDDAVAVVVDDVVDVDSDDVDAAAEVRSSRHDSLVAVGCSPAGSAVANTVAAAS